MNERRFSWYCTNCGEKFIEEVDTTECSEDFEIEEIICDLAKEHIADCMDWQQFFQFDGVRKK